MTTILRTKSGVAGAIWAVGVAGVLVGSTAGCKTKIDAPAAVAPPAAAPVAAEPPPKAAVAPLRIAFSDWPGWTAFEVGIQKGWFKEAGVDVEFSWFEYTPSMEAFAAGKVDAVMMTMGDALVTGAPGARSVAILITDFSNGNDMIVAKKGIASSKALK
ncbi:MAG: ABC transporter substrate-binding protein, partial [Pseudomonadota bacterium]